MYIGPLAPLLSFGGGIVCFHFWRGALRVHPAVTTLTVYRRPEVFASRRRGAKHSSLGRCSANPRGPTQKCAQGIVFRSFGGPNLDPWRSDGLDSAFFPTENLMVSMIPLDVDR